MTKKNQPPPSSIKKSIQKLTINHIHFKKRRATSHKGENGKVLIVGGSFEYVGAVALAGLACLRSGCDWVTIAAPEKVAWAINCLTPDLVTIKLPGACLSTRHEKSIRSLLQKHDTLLIGNGTGTLMETKKLIRKLIHQCPKPKVIDADALKIILLQEVNYAILTPHAGEFAQLLKHSGISARPTPLQNLKAVQPHLGTNVLLFKGPTDYIVSKDRILENTMHDPSMTVAGTGDVLAGLCAGFLAQGYSLFESASMGAYFNGLTGKMLAHRRKGYPSLIASDLARDIPDILNRFKRF